MADDVEMTPISPEEATPVPPKVAPFGATSPKPAAAVPPPPSAPAATPPPAPAAAAPAAASSAGVSTIKLKPVIRKPMIRKPIVGGAKPAAPTPAPAASPAAAKKATQNLKAVTGPIPMQATLRKTGIIAEGILTPAQQQAAKSKTSRISLESAIGVAPTSEAPAPMKTIRLRRPTDLKPAGPKPLVPQKPEQPPADDAPTAATVAAEPTADATTQKKTLKLHRPGIGIKRPTINAAPKSAPAASSGGDVADLPVADLQPTGNFAPLAPAGSGQSAGVPSWVAALSLITSIAALAAVGFLMWHLWQEGVGPVADGNEMAFIQM